MLALAKEDAMNTAAASHHLSPESSGMVDVNAASPSPAAAASSSTHPTVSLHHLIITQPMRTAGQPYVAPNNESEMRQQQMQQQRIGFAALEPPPPPPPPPPTIDLHPYRAYYPLHSVMFDAQGDQDDIIDEQPSSDFPASISDECNLDLSIPDVFQHEHLFEYATTNQLSRDSRWNDATHFVNYLISHQLLTLDMQLRLTYRLDVTKRYAMRMHFQTAAGKKLFANRWNALAAARAATATVTTINR